MSKSLLLSIILLVAGAVIGCSDSTSTTPTPRPKGFYLSISGTPKVNGNVLGISFQLTDSLKPVKSASLRYIYITQQKTDSVTNLNVTSDSLGRFQNLGIVLPTGIIGFKFRATKDTLWSNEVPYQVQ